jgi:hypothetical protein
MIDTDGFTITKLWEATMRDYDDEDDQFIVTDEFDPETLQLMKDLGI